MSIKESKHKLSTVISNNIVKVIEKWKRNTEEKGNRILLSVKIHSIYSMTYKHGHFRGTITSTGTQHSARFHESRRLIWKSMNQRIAQLFTQCSYGKLFTSHPSKYQTRNISQSGKKIITINMTLRRMKSIQNMQPGLAPPPPQINLCVSLNSGEGIVYSCSANILADTSRRQDGWWGK